MSGRPNKTQADINKSRNEYMESLSLQEKINDENLQANKTYLLSGQLPPQSQMQDTRTMAEKLKDIELLKHNIAKELAPVAEPQFAYQIVDAVMKSPLNIDNSLLRFMAQKAPSMTEQLKKILPYGISGDANDLTTIVQFIRNAYTERDSKFKSTKTFFNSQGGEGKSGIISGNDIDRIIESFVDINKNVEIVRNMIPRPYNRNIGISLQTLTNIFTLLKRVLPTTNQIKLMMKDIDDPMLNPVYPEIGVLNIPQFNSNEMTTFFNLIEKLPKYSTMITIIDKCKKFIDLQDWGNVEKSLNALVQELDIMTDPANQPIINSWLNIKNRQVFKENEALKMQETQTREFISLQNEQQKNASKATKVYVINPEDDPVWMRNPAGAAPAPAPAAAPPPAAGIVPPPPPPPPPRPPPPAAPAAPVAGPVNRMPYMVGIINGLNPQDLQQVANAVAGNQMFLNRNGMNQMYDNSLQNIIDYSNGMNIPVQLVRMSLVGVLTAKPAYDPSTIPPTNALGVHGLGIKRRRVGRPRGGTVKPPPPPKEPTFVGFGINEINKKSLDKGIFTMRRNTKTNYMDMPSKHISKNLQGIIKTMIGGGVPKYEELGKLDDEEKDYLYKIVSRSNMEDKLSVPAPSKDQREKDIHNFEVMKGQLMSGNDSQELVKKFKLLTRKLSKQGLLPKADVEDIMDTLTDLGY